MDCIDFDRKFQSYTERWVRENRSRYATVESMEEQMPDIYLRWLNTPAPWLDNVTPADYFSAYSDAGLLVDWMSEYIQKKVPPPDPLLERIVALGEDALPALTARASHLEENREAALLALSLLREISSSDTLPLLRDLLLRYPRDAEMQEQILESLHSAGIEALPSVLSLLESADDALETLLLDYLVQYPGKVDLLPRLIRRLELGKDRALIASYLAKYGDTAALDALMRASVLPEINYLEYIELRNAIEALGGALEAERDFTGDPYFDSLGHLHDA